jgi:hypothetical protein
MNFQKQRRVPYDVRTDVRLLTLILTLTKLNLHAFCACLSSAIVGNDSKHLCQGSNRPQLSKRVVHERNATGTQFDRRLEKTNNARKAKKRETHTDDGYIRDIPSRVMPLHNRD